ncbi:MAG: DUF5666 domain-containing protein [Gammaproteobacteria bacterium]|nr:DUF5666 domain-containing protein [Gammaproteobacteria bacterium]
MAHSKNRRQTAPSTSRDGAGKRRVVLPNSRTLAADELQKQTTPGAPLEVNGMVLGIRLSASIFVLSGGISVRVTPATVYVGGEKFDVALRVPLQVEGTLAEDGVLIASRVTLREHSTGISGPPGSI